MTRQELYNSIDRCGKIPYLTMVYLIQNTDFKNESIKVSLLERLGRNNGQFSQADWLLFFANVSFLTGSPVDISTVQSWIMGKCRLSQTELRTILEYLVFTDNTEPTYLLLGENNQILISE